MIGEIISAGANIAGGILNRNATRENNEALIKDKQADRDMQRYFAENGIRWKVQDAERAGIHPLYALGANTVSYAPTALNTSPASAGAGFAAAGQDLSRAMHATRSAPQRMDAYTKTVQDLSVQKMGLENQLLSSQIAKLNASSNPPMPLGQRYLIDGQGQTASGDTTNYNTRVSDAFKDLVKDKPMERTPGAPGALHQEPAAVTDVGFSRTAGGGYAAIPSKDVKERIEDNLIQEFMHAFRNNILPSLGINESPPKIPVPKGYDAWRYHPFYQEYRPHKKGWGGIHY